MFSLFLNYNNISKIVNNKILSIINLEIEQLKKRKDEIIIKIDEYNKIILNLH